MSETSGPEIPLTKPTKYPEQVKAVIQEGASEKVARKLVARDRRIAHVHKENTALKEEAIKDHLTGAYSRRWMDTQLGIQTAEANRSNTPLSAIFIDLDGFKELNDTDGHKAGDHVLQVAANLMKNSVARDSDTVVRFGGDEFVVLLPLTPQFLIDSDGNRYGGALEIAEKLVHKFEEHRWGPLQAKPPRCSIGIAQYGGDESPQEFLTRADSAMYVAKTVGKNPNELGYGKSNVTIWQRGQAANPERT